jgi:hypothetical protein
MEGVEGSSTRDLNTTNCLFWRPSKDALNNDMQLLDVKEVKKQDTEPRVGSWNNADCRRLVSIQMLWYGGSQSTELITSGIAHVVVSASNTATQQRTTLREWLYGAPEIFMTSGLWHILCKAHYARNMTCSKQYHEASQWTCTTVAQSYTAHASSKSTMGS